MKSCWGTSNAHGKDCYLCLYTASYEAVVPHKAFENDVIAKTYSSKGLTIAVAIFYPTVHLSSTAPPG